MGWDSAPGMGMPCEAPPCAPWVGVPAGAPRAEAVNASAWVRTKRDQTLRPQVQRKMRSTPAAGPVPDDWSDQTPMRLAGARRLKDQRQTPTAGLDRGRRDSSTPPDPVRAACGELRQIRSGSIPSWATLPESESDPSGHARATGIVPPRFLWSETLVKPNNTVIITAPGALKEVLQHPPGDFPKVLTETSASGPATCASVPGSGTARPTP